MKALVKINYKSGISEIHWFEEFEMTYKNGEITNVKWKSTGASSPIYMNIDSIESVYQLETDEE